MKKQDIRNIYTQKVTELLAKGYTVFPDTMNGSQGEIAHIDLTDGSQIVRVLLERGRCWGHIDDGFYGDVVTLTIGRAAADTWVGEHWDGTIWNNHLEKIFEIGWAEVNDRGEGWYTELDDAARIGHIRRERYIAQAKGTREELGEAYKSAALKWVRKQPRMKTCKLEDIGRMYRARNGKGHRYFEIEARGQKMTIGR